MNFILVTVSLASLLNSVVCAPAVSSVHVSFVSGNKATQYSHGTGIGIVPLVQYNLLSRPRLRNHNDNVGVAGDHNLHKRSITHGAEGRGKAEGLGRQNEASNIEQITSTMTSSHGTSTPTNKKTRARISLSSKFNRDFLSTTTTDPDMPMSTFDTTNPTNNEAMYTTTMYSKATTEPTTASSMIQKMMRNRVRFVENPTTSTGSTADMVTAASSDGQTMTMSGGSLLSELSKTTADVLKSKNKKPKDSKAVKRSPFIADNFDAGGITFPDFDEFGGDEFGSLRNFAGASPGTRRGGIGGGRGSLGAHTHANPEALSPDGVFLPPLPTEATEASDYSDNDPYLSDPDTAKYAAQHPPFFAAFPHKRAVLALNEQREHNGLEQNILRSIRPYFAFFEASK